MGQTLAGKVAVITGAGSGIGYATAKLFLGEGARVLAVDLPGKDLEGMFKGEANARFAYADVADKAAPAIIVKAVTEAFDKLDILMNNAGICLPGDVESVTDEIWERQFAVNVTSIFRITQALLPLLKANGRGRVINLGSIMSEMAGPGLLAYGTSKHAVAGLTKAMAVDLGKYKITANYLQPGSILTAMSAPMMEDKTFREYWENKAPVGRLGQPEDVAAAALFLASDAADFVTGLGFNVDGGAIVNF